MPQLAWQWWVLIAIVTVVVIALAVVFGLRGSKSGSGGNVNDRSEPQTSGEVESVDGSGVLPNPLVAWYGATVNTGITAPAAKARVALPGANAFCAFTGWGRPKEVMEYSGTKWPGLKSYLTIFGSGESGMVTDEALKAFTNDVLEDIAAKWDGIVINAENGRNVTIDGFRSFFTRAKHSGVSVIGVTTSHMAPYDFPNVTYNGHQGVTAWSEYFCNEPNIDFFSPQLYSQGDDFDPTFLAGSAQRQQHMLQNAKCRIIPSVPRPEHYAALTTHPQWSGIDLTGYIVWDSWDSIDVNNDIAWPLGSNHIS